MVKSCLPCQRAKVHRHTRAPLGTFANPDARFSHVYLDIVSPLPPSKGHRYFFTCVDRFTRWPMVALMADISAKTAARTFVAHWVANFGVPDVVTTDRGAQFESSLFHELTCLLGTKRVQTTAYHPQSNGMIEKLRRQLKLR